jgi:predicted secreted protein/putative hemolysin
MGDSMTSSRSHGKIKSGIIGLCVMLVLVLLVSGCTQQGATPSGTKTPTTTQTSVGMANPASVACGQAGGTVEIKNDATGNQYGMCTFKNGTSCEEWALYRGEGCKPGVTATPTAEAKKMVTFTEADNGKTGNVTQNTQFAVVLTENPSTGFAWNATLSPGLELQSDNYKNDASTDRPGAAGTHTWVMVAKVTGDQKFSAIYKRSWEPVTGNETAYSVNIRVVKP